MVTKLSTRITRIGLLLVLDLAALGAAFLLSYALRIRLTIFSSVQSLSDYVAPVGVVAVLSLLIFALQGLYRDVRDLSLLEEYAQVIKGLAYGFLLALALTFFFKFYEHSRVLIFLFWPLAVLLVILARYGYYSALKALRRQGWDQLRVALVGADNKIKAIRQLLQHQPQLGYQVAAELAWPRGASPDSPAWNKLIQHTLIARHRKKEIHGVIISDTVKNYPNVLRLIEILQEHGIPHRNVNEAFDLTGLKAPGGESLESLLANLDEGQMNGAYKVSKRVMDEVISFGVLLVTLPLWLLIMLLVKLDSRGPVFFKQERVGYLGKKFWIYKFRSMRVDAPKYAKTPKKLHDPRVTRIGAFLRRTSLDELPQLWNVLKGDMSLVGPRPEMPFIVDKYKTIYRYRFLVKPGLTGLWQVSGRTDKPLEENIKYDLYYIKKQSLLFDWVIMLRTFPTVFFGKGAY